MNFSPVSVAHTDRFVCEQAVVRLKKKFTAETQEYTEVIDMLRVLSASVEILSDEFRSC